jgi:hypothetical protein
MSARDTEISTLWIAHRDATWPSGLGSREGELMTLDTVIGGFVAYYLEERALDSQRVVLLESCLDDLDELMERIDEPARTYFVRLQTLGRLLLPGDPVS